MSGRSQQAAMKPPDWVGGGRIPSLDGFRAISISIVLASHAFSTQGFAGPDWMVQIRRFGGMGVDVFFVISGFLITLLLLREQSRSGTISLQAFYTRRSLRILPAYVAYLGFVAALEIFGQVQMQPVDWIAASTYTVNFLHDVASRWVIGHLWSLSVEEHFYLLWPLALALLGRRAGFAALAMTVAVGPIARYGLWKAGWDINTVTPARLDTIGMGCLLAFATTDRRFWGLARRMETWSGVVVAAAVPLLIFSVGVLSAKERYAVTIERTIDAGLIAVVVFAGVMAPRSLLGRILNARPIVAVGIMSYSLYLWQQPFLNPTGTAWFCRWPLNLILAIVAAGVSLVVIERPFLKLKDRVVTSGKVEDCESGPVTMTYQLKGDFS